MPIIAMFSSEAVYVIRGIEISPDHETRYEGQIYSQKKLVSQRER